jgi:hypothetical protein
MIKYSILLFFTTPFVLKSQTNLTLLDSIQGYFDVVRSATKRGENLWGKDLYGPIIIVNPVTRMAYANTPDTTGILKKESSLFVGKLPMNVPLANASINWNGINWAMILKPLIPKNDTDRINLFVHELFHRSQSSLGFKLADANNNHLNTKEGRIYMRLELEALIKALQTPDIKEQHRHLTSAMVFRSYRRSLFPSADSTENILELNEGIAEYTGTYLSRPNFNEAAPVFRRKIQDFLTSGTFVRTFPYRTTPVYGFFLKEKEKYWNKDVTMKTDLTKYFGKQLKIELPKDPAATILNMRSEYGYENILKDETEREEKTKQIVEEYKIKFIEKPHLTIIFENKKTSFDSRNLTPLEDKGTVYPTMTASDNWGVLSVTNVGALMSPNRDYITVTTPIIIEGKKITGDGWTLTLNEGYNMELDKETRNYTLIKK